MAEQKIERTLRDYFSLGFPSSAKARQVYDLDQILPEAKGSKESELRTLRLLALRYNAQQGSEPGMMSTNAGQLMTAGTIVDCLRYVALLYCSQEQPGSVSRAMSKAENAIGPQVAKAVRAEVIKDFPPEEVASGELTTDEYLSSSPPMLSPPALFTLESTLVALSNENPAFQPLSGLFDDRPLRDATKYLNYQRAIETHFEQEPPLSSLGLPLFSCLRAPMIDSPDSLDGQLAYIHEHWAAMMPSALLTRLDLARDILREETLFRGFGPGATSPLTFDSAKHGGDEKEHEAFSRDADWMSNVVILAKSVYVWLDQLSKKYHRHVRYLSDIPDEELDQLARWGVSGLWLIGLWERSPASQTLKQMMGNAEAKASAYSLYDYQIADDLGGELAYANLRDRARARGIRLASDMVPNHTGIFSRWMVEHPDWFVQRPTSPFPWYRFTGHDLSSDERVAIQIEDGYWDKRDAAVVFRRLDKATGEARFVYHGNDGTSTPWNDTAQLNFTLPEVREAIIQTILHVARMFPIIRFDAAMTLAKKHFQRLWFPLPGEGGAIPSRAEAGLTREHFNRAFPQEFWREVVDRVAAEVPDTLLLAEAFWLMEGYFVRTLGMHRVYNSAFMNMLKEEDNANYRTTIKNVLEFSPEILKRFVNFMNNPDEATAVAQFGRGDKYYGVATMMVTMPGLPMIGHGQVEGLSEKYGMEYGRAYSDEQPDTDMIRRHEREIFPLMRMRQLFSSAENFALYDFVTGDGWVNENVFAYSNRYGDQRALVLYNNAYESTSGSVKVSTSINIGSADQQNLVRRSLREGLALEQDGSGLLRFREIRSGQEYLCSADRINQQGFTVELNGYENKVLVGFTTISNPDDHWWELHNRLGDDGCADLDSAHRRLRVEPLTNSFSSLLGAIPTDVADGDDQWSIALLSFFTTLSHFTREQIDSAAMAKRIIETLAQIEFLLGSEETQPDERFMLVMGVIADEVAAFTLTNTYVDCGTLVPAPDTHWLLFDSIRSQLLAITGHEAQAYLDGRTIADLSSLTWARSFVEADELIEQLTNNDQMLELLLANEHDGKLYINKEQLERVLKYALARALVLSNDTEADKIIWLEKATNTRRQVILAAKRAGYEVAKMASSLSTKRPAQ